MTNMVHKTVIEKLRAVISDGTIVDLPFIAEWDDERLLRSIFRNYREKKGVRLTGFGRDLFTTIFKSYTFSLPEDLRISPSLVVWLERESPLPYFLSHDKIIVFDATLAVRLKLAGADISLLMAAS